MPAASYGSLPFREQIDFFLRKLNVNTRAWTDVLEAEHDVAFMVAGANRDDMVADFREAVRKAIEDGATLEQFRKDFDRIVEQYGWDYTGGRNWRSRVIYETNLRQSYNAGRWAQLQGAKQVLPYWRYRHSDAVEHPRPIHESWDGLVLSADDDWWLTHFPANGWGCQCYVEGISERQLRKLGKSGPDTAPPVNMVQVTIGQRSPGGPRTYLTPEGIDPGFGYAPGRSLGGGGVPPLGPEPTELQDLVARTAQMALDKTLRLPADLGAESAARILDILSVARALQLAFADWQAAVAQGAARTSTYTIGALEPAIVRSLSNGGIEVAAAPIIVRQADIAASLQATGVGAGELAQLPALLRSPVAILLDKAAATLHYIVDSGRGGDAVFDIAVRYQAAGDATGPNAVSQAVATTRGALQARLRDAGLVLLQGAV